MLYVTGDTHGFRDRFDKDSVIERTLKEGDYLFICGDFGFCFSETESEKMFLRELAEKPYTVCFVDGNHENFDWLDSLPVENWNNGKIHVVERDGKGTPKVIHLMRGQVFEICNKKIFTFGGANSIDKNIRVEGKTWWRQEMPDDDEKKEGLANLEKHGFSVHFILTHAAPEETMSYFHPYHPSEAPLNNYLEYIREKTCYDKWYFGHLHMDTDVWRDQFILWYSLRNMETNEALK